MSAAFRIHAELPRAIPVLQVVSEQVLDIEDREQFPNISAAIEHARTLKEPGK